MSDDRDEANAGGHGSSKIIGFRLPLPLANAIKQEAERRGLPLNRLLAEMWQLYRDKKDAG
jgi:predicted DNA binding CopG/RHH family protein